jgi:hypothetical protein
MIHDSGGLGVRCRGLVWALRASRAVELSGFAMMGV